MEPKFRIMIWKVNGWHYLHDEESNIEEFESLEQARQATTTYTKLGRRSLKVVREYPTNKEVTSNEI